uniref:AMP-dependent synthetase/ligase domain-containing protein n=1 Tax=Arcella intermedia TaxID=1963864 RepID=A0A6B2L4T2_9EUKA
MVDVATNEVWTYGKVKEVINDMAIQYYIRGWEPFSPIAVSITPNHRIYPVTVLAAARVGMPTVLIDTALKAREMARQMKLTNVNNIITHNSIVQYVRDATSTLRNIKEILVLDKEDETKDKKDVRWSMEMKYNLLFGKPPGWGAIPDWAITPGLNMLLLCDHIVEEEEPTLKASVLVQRAMSHTILALRTMESKLSPSDVFISTLPPHNILSFTNIIFPWFIGGKSVLLDTYSLEKFIDLVEKQKITFAFMGSSQITELLQSNTTPEQLASIHTIVVPDPISLETINQLEQKFKNIQLKQCYGIPRLSPPLIYSPPSNTKKGSAGVLMPGIEAMVVDPATGNELDVDCEGDLYVRGPQLMSHTVSVLLKPDAPKPKPSGELDSSSFIKTGDRAKVDKDGYWWISPKEKTAEK